MRCQVLYGPRDLRIEDRPEPLLGDRDVLIEVRTVGICGSDLHRFKGDRKIPGPLVLGHEFSGDVVRVGQGVRTFMPKDRVTVQPNFGCGECTRCRSGHVNLCESRLGLSVNIDGCFCDFVAAPEGYVWHVPEDLTYEQAAVIEPLAVAVRAVRRARIQAGDRVLIIGAGPVGLLALQVARVSGGLVVVADMIRSRLEMARDFGASGIIDVRNEDLEAGLIRTFGTLWADVVIETAGVPATVEQALQLAKPGGRVVRVGLAQMPAGIIPAWIVSGELDVAGSYIYTHREFGAAIELARRQVINVQGLITHRYPLEELASAFGVMERGEACKVIIDV